MSLVYIGLGSNIGNREEYLSNAVYQLGRGAGVVLRKSSLYRTAAWGEEKQADFLNQVVMLSTVLSPIELLKVLQHIELESGRLRDVHWGPRTLDLDILLYDDRVMTTAQLTVPHQHLHERNFVLRPLVEIAPDLQHPIFHKTMQELLEDCPDKLEAKIL